MPSSQDREQSNKYFTIAVVAGLFIKVFVSPAVLRELWRSSGCVWDNNTLGVTRVENCDKKIKTFKAPVSYAEKVSVQFNTGLCHPSYAIILVFAIGYSVRFWDQLYNSRKEISLTTSFFQTIENIFQLSKISSNSQKSHEHTAGHSILSKIKTVFIHFFNQLLWICLILFSSLFMALLHPENVKSCIAIRNIAIMVSNTG